MSNVDVFALNVLLTSIRDLYTALRETDECCDEGLRKAEQTLRETQDELQFSETLLVAAQTDESIRLALRLKADARAIDAAMEEVAAIASCNPIAIAAASAEVVAAEAELAEATEAFQRAREHRERMEHRQELAQRCVDLAQENRDMLCLRYQYGRAQVEKYAIPGCDRLRAAHDDLEAYLARVSPQERQSIEAYRGWEPEEVRPVIDPKEIHNRLNPDEATIDATLEYIYVTDPKFHASIDRLCAQMSSPENIDEVETKIKKNVVGRLCEELVIQAFRPMGERIETQGVRYLEDGNYTKVDMILYGLKKPLVLGRGKGMGGKAGGSLAIEVKSGRAAYIYEQVKHMEVQAKGHKSCDISCTVCTRDIKDLGPERDEEVRERLRAAGSPILGMLPKKEELDERCIRFVKGKAGVSHVR